MSAYNNTNISNITMESITADFEKLFLECREITEREEYISDVFIEHIRTQAAKANAVKLMTGSKSSLIFTLPPLKPGVSCCMVYLFIPLILSCIFIPFFTPDSFEALQEYVHTTPCVVENNALVTEMCRPLLNCDICRTLNEVPVIRNISQKEFVEKFAYSGIPVLIKDATNNWTAMETFSYKYFQDLYERTDKITLEEQVRDQSEFPNDAKDFVLPDLACQFFPYNTDLNDLRDAMTMTDARANYEPGEEPWYFGWSNCNPDVQDELRTHYQRPYFLPSDSETSSLDWMFMGGNGKGAPVHLDSVSRPSWQAQISGSKTWTLVPPPECESVCVTMNVTVHQGDIFVIDTNMWYHATYIHPGPLSITIGSEYD